MNKKNRYLSLGGTVGDLFVFMFLTFDGVVSSVISIFYFFWGAGGALGFFDVAENVDPLALIIFSFVIPVVFLWHRKGSRSDDWLRSIYCVFGVLAIASIPLHKFIRSMM
ncbi:hypothetical protein ACSC9U_09290 [Pseudomonas solani]|uniref:hypothetical protein n=1 Tax=Pseudomonas solani TaxID=2731552 RepID=UPI003F4A9C35